jgi:hypothetical protein
MSAWTPQEDAILISLAALKKTSTEIGAAIKKATGNTRTRNAIIARATRNKIALYGSKPYSVWDDPARTEYLRELWKRGLSQGVMAAQMTAKFGEKFTIGAIASKGASSGIAKEFNRQKIANLSRPVSRPKPVRVLREVKPVPQAVPVDTSHARPWLTRLRGECKFPLGEAGNIHSCCAPVFGNTGYCQAHAAVCFLPRPVKRAA